MASVLLQSTESHLADGETKDDSRVEASLEPESPNPFSQLTDQELEEYKKEVERKKLGLDGKCPGAVIATEAAGLRSLKDCSELTIRLEKPGNIFRVSQKLMGRNSGETTVTPLSLFLV